MSLNDDEHCVFSYVCGMSSVMVRATTPLARLYIYRWGIVLRGRNAILRNLVPEWTARFDDMDPVQPVVFGNRHRSRCLRFVIASRNRSRFQYNSWAICRPHNVNLVLDSIEYVGGRIERAPVRVARMDPLREIDSEM